MEDPRKSETRVAPATVTCGKAGKVARSFAVVGPPTAPARIVVQKNGFSQRVFFSSRKVSYGIELSNPSPENDALEVDVLVNFLDATNRVVDTDTTNVDAVGAGTIFYLGGSTTIPDGSQVSKIEIVTRIGGQQPKKKLGPASPTSSFRRRGLRSRLDRRRRRPDPERQSDDAAEGDERVGGDLRLRRQRHRRLDRPELGPAPAGRPCVLRGPVNGADAIPFDRVGSASVSMLGAYQAIA